MNRRKTTAWLGFLGTLTAVQLQAQVTAIWTGPATGGEWNTAANWSLGGVPGNDANQTTNAFIGAGTNVSYNVPMTAAGLGALSENGTLNVNAAGFNLASVAELNPGGTGKFFINNGGVVSVTGNFGVTSNSAVALTVGGSLTVGGNMIVGSGSTGGTSGGNASSSALMTNFGGAFTAASTSLNPGNGSISSACRLVIAGGTNNLGNFTMQRGVGAANAPLALGQDGLVISNGFVNTTSISVGNNAHGILYLVNGTVTNSGAFTLKNGTVSRPARFLQTGGLFVNADPNLISPTPSGTGDTVYTVTGGTNQIYGISFLVRPGHVFPLRAKPGGVLERPGHTEAAVDLATLARLHPSGVLCELMNDDGSVARLGDIARFKDRFGLRMISIADLVLYRAKSCCGLPSPGCPLDVP